MELMDAIRGRRSVRKYKADMPSDEIISYVLRLRSWRLHGQTPVLGVCPGKG